MMRPPTRCRSNRNLVTKNGARRSSRMTSSKASSVTYLMVARAPAPALFTRVSKAGEPKRCSSAKSRPLNSWGGHAFWERSDCTTKPVLPTKTISSTTPRAWMGKAFFWTQLLPPVWPAAMPWPGRCRGWRRSQQPTRYMDTQIPQYRLISFCTGQPPVFCNSASASAVEITRPKSR